MSNSRPLLIVVSAPSGAGKTTLCGKLLSEFPSIARSVSCTTRKPRTGEVDGADYFFLSDAEFDDLADHGEFIEHAVVHGHRYGTRAATVRDNLEAGRDVLLAIDVQGAEQIRERIRTAPESDPLKRGFVDVFIAPPSMDELRRRLVCRNEDSGEEIALRTANAEREMACVGMFMYRMVNDDLERAYGDLKSIFKAEHMRTYRPNSWPMREACGQDGIGGTGAPRGAGRQQ